MSTQAIYVSRQVADSEQFEKEVTLHMPQQKGYLSRMSWGIVAFLSMHTSAFVVLLNKWSRAMPCMEADAGIQHDTM